MKLTPLITFLFITLYSCGVIGSSSPGPDELTVPLPQCMCVKVRLYTSPAKWPFKDSGRVCPADHLHETKPLTREFFNATIDRGNVWRMKVAGAPYSGPKGLVLRRVYDANHVHAQFSDLTNSHYYTDSTTATLTHTEIDLATQRNELKPLAKLSVVALPLAIAIYRNRVLVKEKIKNLRKKLL